MSYLIIATWDDNNRPTKINTRDTKEDAQNLVDHLKNELGYAGVFYTEHPGSEDSRYLTVDPDAKTVTFDGGRRTVDRLLPYLSDYRWQVETGGIEVNNMPVHTDRDAQAKLTAARIVAKEDNIYSVRWKVADGSFHTLDADTIIAVADAVRGHVEAAFAAEADTEAEIGDGTLTSESQVKSRFDELMP